MILFHTFNIQTVYQLVQQSRIQQRKVEENVKRALPISIIEVNTNKINGSKIDHSYFVNIKWIRFFSWAFTETYSHCLSKMIFL